MRRIEMAAQVVASYLAGAEVPGKELARAVDLLNDSGRPEIERLRFMLAATPDWLSDCRVFKESLPELMGMSREQRKRERPGMEAHMNSCAQCRALFLELTLDESGGPGPQGHQQGGAGSGDVITVELDGRGGFSRVESPATRKLPQPADFSDRKELLFADQGTGSNLTLTLRPGPRGLSGLDLDLLDSRGRNITSGSVVIEPLGAESGPSLEFKSLAEFKAAAPELRPGSFRISIYSQAAGDGKSRAEWRFDLNLESKE